MKIVLRFAYNHGTGHDAPLDVILQDIQSLAPIVRKYKSVIYSMNTGFIGYWGEGHDSTCGNNTPDNMRQILQAEQQAFGAAMFMLNRQSANILSWELGPTLSWGIHDDHYAMRRVRRVFWNAPLNMMNIGFHTGFLITQPASRTL